MSTATLAPEQGQGHAEKEESDQKQQDKGVAIHGKLFYLVNGDCSFAEK
jgi:hypothetical protein